MKKILLFTIILSFILLPAVNVSADTVPVPLNLDYPSFGNYNLDKNQDLNQIVAWFYYLIISIAGISAFVMIVWGGVQWLSSAGNPGTIGSAKDKIQSALIGLVIVLGSYLILQVINPDLLKLKDPSFDVLPGTNSKDISLIDQVALNPDANTNPAFDVFLPEDTYAGRDAQPPLLNAGFKITTGDCKKDPLSPCTSLQGIPISTVKCLIEFKKDANTLGGWDEGSANNIITITGGTEIIDGKHGQGKSVVDIAYHPSLIDTLKAWAGIGSLTYICENESTEVKCDARPQPNHFHVVFSENCSSAYSGYIAGGKAFPLPKSASCTLSLITWWCSGWEVAKSCVDHNINCPDSRFGAIRSGGERYHEAVDIYNLNDKEAPDVYAVSDGTVLRNSYTEGKSIFCSYCTAWGYETYVLAVKNNTGEVINYAEIIPNESLTIGKSIKAGQVIGKIARNFTGVGANSGMGMIHFEMYKNESTYNNSRGVTWTENQYPEGLLDPTEYLNKIRNLMK